jgi:uracil-DNA glycosylase
MSQRELQAIHERLRACRKCPNVCDVPVHGPAVDTQIMILGQAPGVHEGRLGRPFAHTAGKTLFKWLKEATGLDEEEIRSSFYFSAVARCFPGKARSGKGDRPPSPAEVKNCSQHLADEMRALKPRLVLAVGRSAINEVFRESKIKNPSLEDVVGKKLIAKFHGETIDVIALPHPSGVSRWPHTPLGKKKLARALKLLKAEILENV